MRITVREVRDDELPQLLRLLHQMDESMYPPRPPAEAASQRAIFRQIRSDSRQHLFVAEAAGRLVGTAHLVIIPHLGRSARPSGVVDGVVVDTAWRGRGVGAALMRAVADTARRHGCYKLALTSNLARTGAHRFYSRLGWKRTHYGYSLELD